MERIYDFVTGLVVCLLFAIGFLSVLFAMDGLLYAIRWLYHRWLWLRWFSRQ